MTVFFHIPPGIAVSTSLDTTIPTTAVGTFSHWKAGNVNWRFGLTMQLGGVVGSIIGSLCSGMLPEDLYNKVTGAILLLLAVQMLVSYRKNKQKKDDTQSAGQIHKKSTTVKAVCFGLLGGIMSGLVGLSGGGPIIAGLMILGCQALETVGTSALVLLGIAVTGFITHLGIGSIDWKLVGLLTVGTICGAFVGPILLKMATPCITGLSCKLFSTGLTPTAITTEQMTGKNRLTGEEQQIGRRDPTEYYLNRKRTGTIK